jgi:hypothetical protein
MVPAAPTVVCTLTRSTATVDYARQLVKIILDADQLQQDMARSRSSEARRHALCFQYHGAEFSYSEKVKLPRHATKGVFSISRHCVEKLSIVEKAPTWSPSSFLGAGVDVFLLAMRAMF